MKFEVLHAWIVLTLEFGEREIGGWLSAHELMPPRQGWKKLFGALREQNTLIYDPHK